MYVAKAAGGGYHIHASDDVDAKSSDRKAV
jgi:hypothetical protein